MTAAKTHDRARLRAALRVAAEELDVLHTTQCEYMIVGAAQTKVDRETLREILQRYGPRT
jgi:hypothetical protein